MTCGLSRHPSNTRLRAMKCFTVSVAADASGSSDLSLLLQLQMQQDCVIAGTHNLSVRRGCRGDAQRRAVRSLAILYNKLYIHIPVKQSARLVKSTSGEKEKQQDTALRYVRERERERIVKGFVRCRRAKVTKA